MRSAKYVVAVLLVLTLAACDESKQKSVEAPRQPTAIETNLRVLELAKAGKPIDALRVGEEFLRSGSDSDGALHSTLAKLYTELGDTESALRHLQQGGPVANSSTTVIVTREVPPLQPAPQAQAPLAPAMTTMTDGASASIGPNGIQVRAGGASAVVRN